MRASVLVVAGLLVLLSAAQAQSQPSGGTFDTARDYYITGHWVFKYPPIGVSGGGGGSTTPVAGGVPGNVQVNSAGMLGGIANGTTGQVLTSNGSSAPSFQTLNISPGGSDTQVQFNDGGSFGGSGALTFDKTATLLNAGVLTTGPSAFAVSSPPLAYFPASVATVAQAAYVPFWGGVDFASVPVGVSFPSPSAGAFYLRDSHTTGTAGSMVALELDSYKSDVGGNQGMGTISAFVWNAGDGTVDGDIRGIDIGVESDAGTVTGDVSGLHVQSADNTGTIIGKWAGLLIGNQTAGATGGDYAIYYDAPLSKPFAVLANGDVQAATYRGTNGAEVDITGGSAANGSGLAGKAVVLTAGDGDGVGNGGDVTLTSGGTGSGAGGNITLNPGTGFIKPLGNFLTQGSTYLTVRDNVSDSFALKAYNTNTHTDTALLTITSANPPTLQFDNGARITPTTFSSLPACAAGTEGTSRAVTDSSTATWGATIAGSGSNHVLAYCNGTNWTVMAK